MAAYDEGVDETGTGEAPIPAGRLGRGVGPGIEIPPARLTEGGGRFEIPVTPAGAGDAPIAGAGYTPMAPTGDAVDDVLRAGMLDRLIGGSVTLGRPGTLDKLTGGNIPETTKAKTNQFHHSIISRMTCHMTIGVIYDLLYYYKSKSKASV